MAIGAHPDDIEFLMAGTLLLLREAGWAIHYMTIASGSCGSLEHGPTTTRTVRRREAKRAARRLGAVFHPSLVDDLEILYELKTLRRLAAVIRDVAPSILLVPSPEDYMEDHMVTARLAVTAAFSRGMPNFRTMPRRPPVQTDVTIYHAMPYGLRDPLRRRVIPGVFVDTASVHAAKREALAEHASQRAWLDASQGLDSYVESMEEMSRAVGRLSERFEHAEGWRRHFHPGLASHDADPLLDILRERYCVNPNYETALEEGRFPSAG